MMAFGFGVSQKDAQKELNHKEEQEEDDNNDLEMFMGSGETPEKIKDQERKAQNN